MLKPISSLFLLPLLLFILFGCSSNHTDPATPSGADPQFSLPVSDVDVSETNSSLLGIWDMSFDTESMTAKVEPNRNLNAHLNVTAYLPTPLIEVNSYDPATEIVNVYMQLHNPFYLDAYDLRVIFYTDGAGHRLVNFDNWTDLFDIGGGLPINPFKAFAKYNPDHKFGGLEWHGEYLDIKCPNGNFFVQFAIEVSFPGNCAEPYEMSDFVQGNLNADPGSWTNVQISVFDWQNDTSSVNIFVPQITGQTFVPFYQINDTRWGLDLTNEVGAPAGQYTAYLVAASTGLNLYHELIIQVVDATYYGWARSWGGTTDDFGKEIIIDSNNNIIVGGAFSGENVDFDTGTGTDNQSSNGLQDAFISKYDAVGNFIWAGTWGAARDDLAAGLAFAEFDSIVVAGHFIGTVDFDPGPGNTTHIANGEFGFQDVYVSKFSAYGDFRWVLPFGGTADDKALDCATDTSGNIYVTGTFQETVDFDPGTGTDNKTAVGGDDIFLVKFNSNSDFLWVRTWGSSGTDPERANDLVIDSSNNVYVLGEFQGTVDFNPGTGTENRTAAGMNDIFLSKFDPNGNFLWVGTWGGPASSKGDYGAKMVIDNSNNLYVTGSFKETVDFDPGTGTTLKMATGGADAYVSKFNLNGDFINVYTWGGNSNDECYGLSTSNEGDIYICGTFYGNNVDFDPGTGVDIHNAIGQNDFFLSRLNSSGVFQWARTLGAAYGDYANAVAVDDTGKVYTTGGFQQTIDFNPGPNIENHESNGAADIFLWKVLSNGRWE